MKITIGFELDSEIDSGDLVTWLMAGGKPVEKRKARKPRPPMSDEEKAAFRAKMVAGQEAKAKERAEEEKSKDKVARATKLGEKLAKGSKSIAAKKPASKRKPAAKKKPAKKAA